MFSAAARAAGAVARVAQAERVVKTARVVLANPIGRVVTEAVVVGVVIDLAFDTYTGSTEWKRRINDSAERRAEKRAAKKQAKDTPEVEITVEADGETTAEVTVPNWFVRTAKKTGQVIKATPKAVWHGIVKTGRFIYYAGKYVLYSVIRTLLAFVAIAGLAVALVLTIVEAILGVPFLAVVYTFRPQSMAKWTHRLTVAWAWMQMISYGYTMRLMRWFAVGYFDVSRPRAERQVDPKHVDDTTNFGDWLANQAETYLKTVTEDNVTTERPAQSTVQGDHRATRRGTAAGRTRPAARTKGKGSRRSVRR